MTSIGDRVRVVEGKIEDSINQTVSMWVGTPYKSARIMVGMGDDGDYYGLTCETIHKGNRVIVHPGNFGMGLNYAATRATAWTSVGPSINKTLIICSTSATGYIRPAPIYYTHPLEHAGTNWCGFSAGWSHLWPSGAGRYPTQYFKRSGCPTSGIFSVSETWPSIICIGPSLDCTNENVAYHLLYRDPTPWTSATGYSTVSVNFQPAAGGSSGSSSVYCYVLVSMYDGVNPTTYGTQTLRRILPTEYNTPITIAFAGGTDIRGMDCYFWPSSGGIIISTAYFHAEFTSCYFTA